MSDEFLEATSAVGSKQFSLNCQYAVNLFLS